MVSLNTSERVDIRRLTAFLGLTFALSWTAALVVAVSSLEVATIQGQVFVVVTYMWAPAIAAVAVQRSHNRPIRSACGLHRGRLGWIAVAWLAPLALLGLTIAIGLLIPDVTFTTDYGAFLRELGVPQARVDASLAALEELPVPPLVLFVGQGLLAGLTINALAALGEEVGWRGLLLSELAPLGFWRLSVLTGGIWGIWHAPLILQGHNFPEAPLAGVVVMTVWTIAVSPVYTYVTVRAGSVLAPTLLHGSFNALGFLSLGYLAGAGAILTAPVGVAGIGAALVATGLCVGHDRFVAADRVTAGDPVTPWD